MTKKKTLNDRLYTWDRVYLLGWYDETGNSFLTTWYGSLPMLEVVVTGCARVPLWKAPVPKNAKLHPVPTHLATSEAKVAYATAMGGYYAFGWWMNHDIERLQSPKESE